MRRRFIIIVNRQLALGLGHGQGHAGARVERAEKNVGDGLPACLAGEEGVNYGGGGVVESGDGEGAAALEDEGDGFMEGEDGGGERGLVWREPERAPVAVFAVGVPARAEREDDCVGGTRDRDGFRDGRGAVDEVPEEEDLGVEGVLVGEFLVEVEGLEFDADFVLDVRVEAEGG